MDAIRSIIETILQDVRSGFRSLRKAPGPSLAVTLTLALGIGANTAIFSVVYAVLLRPLPYPAGERLVQVLESTLGQYIPVTWMNFQHWRAENHSFERMAAFETADLTLTGRGGPLLTRAGIVSSDFFQLTGSQPLIGRTFNQADDRPGAAPTVVITSEFWAGMLGGNPRVLGTTLTLNGQSSEVIGVLRPGLNFFTRPVAFYLPVGPREGKPLSRAEHGSMFVLGLLKPGISRATARGDLDSIMTRLAIDDPGPEADHRSYIAWLAGVGTDDIRRTLLMLLAAVGLVLIIACANVTSLLLMRSTARAREIATRIAIGAGGFRLARQLLTENLVLAVMGGGLGLLFAQAGLRALVLAGPRDIPRLLEARLDPAVLLFTSAVTVITGLLAGLAPVFQARKVDLTAALKDGSRGAGSGRRAHTVQGALVVAELAMTLVLAFACGLLLRSLYLAQTSDPGFNASGVIALELQLPPSRYQSTETIRQFYDRLMQAIRREPGVESVGAVDCPPSTGGCAKGWYSISGMPAPARAEVPLTILSSVDPAYFRTMGIRLLAGRGFTAEDREAGPGLAVINEKIARRWWPAAPQLAVGHSIKLGGPYIEGPAYQIIGVSGNVSQSGLDSEPFSEIYVPFAQHTAPAMVVMIRASGDPARVVPTVRRQVASIDRGVPIQSLRPFEQWMAATLERRRFSTLLLGIFGGLAMVLAAVGVYGVLGYWVGVRERDIAVRVALGAQPAAILTWAGGHALRLITMGIALGVSGSWAISRGLTGMVYGIPARNPAILIAASAVVTGIAVLGAGVPMWRAARINVLQNLN